MTCMQYLQYLYAIFLAAILLTLATPWVAIAQPTEPVVSNVQVTVRDGYVDITYDLEQAERLTCWVSVWLSKDGGETYEYPVSSASGDCYKPVNAGQGRAIEWNAFKDYPNEHISDACIQIIANVHKAVQLPSDISMNMIYIPSGTFYLGGCHEVNIEGFWISQYEITVEQYFAMGATILPYGDSSGSLQKALSIGERGISYTDSEGNYYRVPSESEWEYACRAGTDTTYYWGEKSSLSVWFVSDNRDLPVGRKNPNKFGLYDMIGNMNELCLDDWRGDDYGYPCIFDGAPNDGSPWLGGPFPGYKIVRGYSSSFDRGFVEGADMPEWKETIGARLVTR